MQKCEIFITQKDLIKNELSLLNIRYFIDVCRQYSAFTMDVIARCAFGMTIDNLGEKDDPFMKNAKAVFSPPANKTPLILVLCKCTSIPFLKTGILILQLHSTSVIFPQLMRIIGERMFLSYEFQFFVDILQNLMTERKSDQEVENHLNASINVSNR